MPPANQFDPVHGFDNPTAGPHLIHDDLSYYALTVHTISRPPPSSATSYGKIKKHYTLDSPI